MRPGTSGGGGGGGSYSVGKAGRIQGGRITFSGLEGETVVYETHVFHRGHEIVITDRVRMDDDGKALAYENEIVGPNGKAYSQKVSFDVD